MPAGSASVTDPVSFVETKAPSPKGDAAALDAKTTPKLESVVVDSKSAAGAADAKPVTILTRVPITEYEIASSDSDSEEDSKTEAAAVSSASTDKSKSLPKSKTISFVAETLLPTVHGKYRVRAFRDSSKPLGLSDVTLLIWGQVEGRSDVPVRVHDQCVTSEVFGSLKCDCKDQLDAAKMLIRDNPDGGIIFYLPQEGRGIGLSNKIAAYALQEKGYDTVDSNRMLGFPDDAREYSCVPTILDLLGIKSVSLITNNPRKIRQLLRHGVNITSRIPLVMPSNEHSDKYISVKRARMGHFA